MTEQAITDCEATVDQGLRLVGRALQAALAARPVDADTVMAMDRLRSRYIFHSLELRRAEIIKIDGSPAMQQAVASISSAVKDFDSIHQHCQANTDWIGKASKALDHLMNAVNRLKTFS